MRNIRTAVLILVAVVVAIIVLRPRTRAADTPAPQTATHGEVHTSPAAHTSNAADSALIAGLVLTVHKSPTCGCCQKWVEHMEANGFKVMTVDHQDMTPVKRELGVTKELESCHTAKIGSYVIEGHVPAEDVMQLLREKPEVAGIAAPGMPMGSPGMEALVKEKYDVVSFDKTGATKVFSHR